MNDYFYKVCYNFYKRQMQIWILLQHKYLRVSHIAILERRFYYKDMGTLKKESQTNVVSAFEPGTEGTAE